MKLGPQARLRRLLPLPPRLRLRRGVAAVVKVILETLLDKPARVEEVIKELLAGKILALGTMAEGILSTQELDWQRQD